MRAQLKRLYEFIAAPLYVRLSRDVTIHTQSLLSENLEYQEKAMKQLLEQMVRFDLELERLKNRSGSGTITPPGGRTEEQMEKLVARLDSHLQLVQVANEQQIPLTELFEWKARYSGMSPQVIRRVRQLEHENEKLQIENQLLKDRSGLVPLPRNNHKIDVQPGGLDLG